MWSCKRGTRLGQVVGLKIEKIQKSGRASRRVGPGIIIRKNEEIDGRAGRDHTRLGCGSFP